MRLRPAVFFAACVAINCGPGECKKGDGFSYSCECHPGYVNFLNLTGFPCVKKCTIAVSASIPSALLCAHLPHGLT